MMTLPARQKILGLYAILSFAVLMGCAPNMNAQNAGAVAAFLALIFAYIMESKHDKDSLETHHAIFIIRTIWIWSTFLLIGLCGAGFIISREGDMSAIDTLMAHINEGAVPDEGDMQATIDSYLQTNYDLIFKTTIVWIAPAQIYAAYRTIRGAMRAYKGYRVQNLRAWF